MFVFRYNISTLTLHGLYFLLYLRLQPQKRIGYINETNAITCHTVCGEIRICL